MLTQRGEMDRLLEWQVEEGWEPLCTFLGKEVPKEPFPRTNDGAGFDKKIEDAIKRSILVAVRNMGVVALVLAGAVVYVRGIDGGPKVVAQSWVSWAQDAISRV
jgi:hypothetical protein